MARTKTMSIIARAAVGALVGAAVGFLAEKFFFWDGPFSILGDMSRLPATTLRQLDHLQEYKYVVGPVTGAVFFAAICIFFGGCELRGAWKTGLLGMLLGAILGFIVGGYVYPLFRVGGDPTFYGKEMVAISLQGIFYGIPSGVFLGILVGVLVSLAARKTMHGSLRPSEK